MNALDRALGQSLTSGEWAEIVRQGEEEVRLPTSLDPEVYLAAFGSGPGALVLEDMFERYVNVSRVIPGEGADAAYYREGMAQVVFHIMHMMAMATNGETDEQG